MPYVWSIISVFSWLTCSGHVDCVLEIWLRNTRIHYTFNHTTLLYMRFASVISVMIFQLQFQLTVNRFFSMSFSFKIFQFQFQLIISVIWKRISLLLKTHQFIKFGKKIQHADVALQHSNTISILLNAIRDWSISSFQIQYDVDTILDTISIFM